MADNRQKRLEMEAARLAKKYGHKTGALGSAEYQLDVVPTGSLALDYALGTGGWPLGHPVHLFGEPDIGKSSTLGLAALRNAQAKGLTTGLIAVEPGFDANWAAKNGVNPDLLVIARPDDGEAAMNILYEWVTDDIIDFIIFDSIGGVVNPKENQEEGKAQVGGASNLITMGIRRILMPTWKKNKGLILLNQIRDDLKSKYANVKPPGGHLLQHACDVWVHLRQSSGSDMQKKIKEAGEDVLVRRNLTAQITRNKLCEGTGNKAKFWFNLMTTSEFGPVGLDSTSDIIATGMRTGVIQRGGAYYRHESFPGDKHQLMGTDAVAEYFAENPKVIEQIRRGVMAAMMKKVHPAKQSRPDLNAFDKAAAEDR